MPVDSAELHSTTHLRPRCATRDLGGRSAKADQTAHQMQAVHCGDQVEEGIGWIGRYEIPREAELSPSQELPSEEYKGGCSPRAQADDDAVHVVPARGHVRPLQR